MGKRSNKSHKSLNCMALFLERELTMQKNTFLVLPFPLKKMFLTTIQFNKEKMGRCFEIYGCLLPVYIIIQLPTDTEFGQNTLHATSFLCLKLFFSERKQSW